MARKAGVSIRTKVYEKFKGVDFTTDPSMVSDDRSPWAVNMISDNGGMPEKRAGWKSLAELESEINGLYLFKYNGAEHFLIHAGTKLYRWYGGDDTPVQLMTGLPDDRSKGAYMNGAMYIFTGNDYISYNGVTVSSVADSAYVPLVTIGAKPDGSGATSYQNVNLLTAKQRAMFAGDGTSKVYHLPVHPIASVQSATVDGAAATYTADLANGTVTFATAPGVPQIEGQDNVEIAYTATTSGVNRIKHCRQCIAWGINGAEDRIVCSGDPDYPNYDYISDYNNPAYFPDLNYSVLGTSDTAIMGYARINDGLAIIKEDRGNGSTVFLRKGALDEKGNAVFALYPALAGIGAVGRFGFGNIGDERLVLTGNGVYAITNNQVISEKIAQNRSHRVDPKLLTEDLSEAVMENWKNMLMIFVDGKVYILDGNQKSYSASDSTDFLYECYYFEDVPARCVLKVTRQGVETMYFGTEDGKVCRFKTDIQTVDRYNDDGDPIFAVLSTKADDDGDPMILKTLLKKGNAVTLKPYMRSSAKVCVRTDRDAVEWQANYGTMDIFDWEDIDFSRFTFNANDLPQEIPINRKVKNYKRLQFIIKNDGLNEGFGVYKLSKHFVTGNFAKR
ncbi:MAG: hypothetical protein Q4A04_08455 [Eubacteriales bacterium]|nr:hypothetical protein [Eubacteriales bacterium]